ncbi:hypothetical protein C8R47DRAFT_1144409 [Mycena vitilis]|nr:hypothetical protein C8R47DRAFT_1144409 [Mycena vitilis]
MAMARNETFLPPPIHTPNVTPPLKRIAPPPSSSDSNPPLSKKQRLQSRNATPASREGSPAVRPSPACLICTHDHSAFDHPSDKKAFADGTSFFVKLEDRNLRTTQPFRGEHAIVCISWNLKGKCTHGSERLHICSLCGGPHTALSRDAACRRVRGGAFVA